MNNAVELAAVLKALQMFGAIRICVATDLECHIGLEGNEVRS